MPISRLPRWRDLRAGLIAAAIGFGLVDGCPLPPRRDTPAWERGMVEPIREVQHVVEWPVAWIRPRLRISQQWALYQAPGTERYRMSIEGETADRTWHVLFRVDDPDHTEDAERLLYARVRGAWDPTNHPPGQYWRFASWICGRMLARHPDLVAARVRMEKVHIVPGAYRGTGRYAYTYVRRR